jgi:hypothetical protein
MYAKATAAGLPITQANLDGLQTNPDAEIDPDVLSKWSLWNRSVQSNDRVHYTVSARDGHNNPPESCPRETPQTEVIAQAIARTPVRV